MAKKETKKPTIKDEEQSILTIRITKGVGFKVEYKCSKGNLNHNEAIAALEKVKLDLLNQ